MVQSAFAFCDYVSRRKYPMANKTFKKVVSGALAVCATVASLGLFTACETNRPAVEMQIEFNDVTYYLNYTLYRKVAPNTVKHFIALAENGYYDNLCVHDYTSSKWYTGSYSYDAATESLQYKAYYDVVKTYANFPVSVWTDSNMQNPTYTLYGEFTDNDFVVQNGAKKETFGSLTMYYSQKDTEGMVVVKRAGGADTDGNITASRLYKYNSATSQFYISLSSTSKSNAGYCTFATLDDETPLKDLQAAITAYIADTYASETDDFTADVEMTIDGDDAFVEAEEKTFNCPNKPIIIKKVSVKRY